MVTTHRGHRWAAWASLLVSICLVPCQTLGIGPARAGGSQSYSVPLSDGYGIGECMRAGSDCGRVMADAWCEAHGHAHAAAYGASEDVTGAIKTSDKVFQVAEGDIIIRCDD